MSIASPRRSARFLTLPPLNSSGRRAGCRRTIARPRLLDNLLEDRTLLAFSPISQPTAAYVANTNLIPITGADGVTLTSLSDGTETVTFSTTMTARTVPAGGWMTWGSPPDTETATPRVLDDGSAQSVTLTFSQPISTFGVEMEQDTFNTDTLIADFFSGATLVGTVSRSVNSSGAPLGPATNGARLFAATSTSAAQTFTSVVLRTQNDDNGFAIAQIRYALPEADLSVTKTDTPDPVFNGANLTYTVTVTNNGPLDAQNTVLSDALPAGTTFVSATAPGGWSLSTPAPGANGTVFASTSSLASGASAVFTIVVNVGAATPAGTVLSNTASASSTTPDFDGTNNSDTETTTVAQNPNPVINGTGGDDTLVITATGPNTGSYSLNGGPAVPFAGISSFAFNGLGGNDLLRILDPAGGRFGPAGGVSYNGGTQSGAPGDRLELLGGTATNVTYNFSPDGADGHNGTIVRDGATITYTGLEPITNSGTAANIIFNLPDDGLDNLAILEDDGVVGNGMSRLRSGNATFETTTFANPSGSLTLNASDDGETMTIARFDGGLTAPVTVNGNTGNDTVVFLDGATLNGGTINGGAGTNSLDYSAYTTPVAVNLGLGSTGFTANMAGNQEVPPTPSTATAVATATYNVANKTLDITVVVDGITPAEVTGFHIHRAPVGVNGPIIIDFTGVAPLVPTPTGFTFTATGLPVNPFHEAALLGGVTYVNIHNSAFPGGVIRGQLFSNGNVNLTSGTATGTGGISNIQNATGGSGSFNVGTTPFGDSLVGNNVANVLRGGPMNDAIVSGPGGDTMQGDAGNDVMVWSNGDGTDIIDGGTGTDLVQVNGATAADDVFTVGANGSRVDFDRISPGPFSLDIGTVETLTVNGIGGADSFDVNSLAGVADLTAVNLNGFADSDTFNVTPAAAVTANVNGGFPAPPAAPGDTLNVALAGTTSPSLTATSSALGLQGSYTFGNRLPVNFQQVETLSPLGDLAVTKVDTPDPVTAGTNLTFTVTLTNAGPVDAQNVSLSDTLPAGTTFVSAAAPAGWTIAAPPAGGTGTVTFARASFAAGAAPVFTIVVLVGAGVPAGTTISNTAAVTSTTPDSSPANNSATSTTTVATSANLAVTKAAGASSVDAGSTLTYTISLTNNGPSDAQAVSVTDGIPAGTTFVSATAPAGWTITTPAVGGTGTVTFARTSVAPGASPVFTIVVQVANDGARVVSNTVNVASATSDPDPGNNSFTTNTPINSGFDLVVTKTVSANPVAPGANLTYTVTVRNAGFSPALSVSLYELLPDRTTFVSNSGAPGWTSTNPGVGSGGVIISTTPSLAAGAAATFIIVVNVPASVRPGSVLTNRAVVTTTTFGELNTSNNSTTASVTVAAPPAPFAAVAPRTASVTTRAGGSQSTARVSSTPNVLIAALDQAIANSGGLVADILRQKTLSGLLSFGG